MVTHIEPDLVAPSTPLLVHPFKAKHVTPPVRQLGEPSNDVVISSVFSLFPLFDLWTPYPFLRQSIRPIDYLA